MSYGGTLNWVSHGGNNLNSSIESKNCVHVINVGLAVLRLRIKRGAMVLDIAVRCGIIYIYYITKTIL